MYSPAQTDCVVVLLPNPLHLNIQLLEKQITVKSEAPEDQFVVVQTVECIPGVTECHVLPEYVICSSSYTGKTLWGVTFKSTDSRFSLQVLKDTCCRGNWEDRRSTHIYATDSVSGGRVSKEAHRSFLT
jgi:hypothetical protein